MLIFKKWNELCYLNKKKMNLIGRIGILAVVMMFTMASSCKENKKEKENGKGKVSTETPADEFYTGIVTKDHAADGCDYLIKMTNKNANMEYILPIGLDVKYKKQGLKLKFTYRLSRASSGTCTVGSPAILENIEVIP